MSLSRRLRAAVLALTVPAAAVLAQTALAGDAGAITATKVQLRNGQLLVEGVATVQGVGFVSVESTTSAAGTRAGTGGRYKVEATGFTAPDCFLTVRDRGGAITVSIPNCTPSPRPVPSTPAPPTGSCVITPQPTATTLTAGAQSVFWMYATGCDQSVPLTFTFVAGAIPTGMTMGTFQTASSGNIIGTPSVRGTYRFTVQARDGAGRTDQESFAIVVA